jgi:hypothetical protein
MLISRFALVLGGCLLAGMTLAQAPTPAQEAVHNELRKLRDGVIAAFNKQDIDGLLTFVHPKAIVTWQDASVCRSHQDIRDYYQKMMTGDKRIVQSVSAQAEVDQLTTIYNDNNGVAAGSVDQQFVLTDGMSFHLPSRWTADVIKEGDRWLISSLHVSANMFDNPVQNLAIKKTALWVGVPAVLGGLLLGFIGGRMGRRRTP